MLAKKLKKRKIAKKKEQGRFPGFIAIIFILFAVYLSYTNIMIFLERSRINSDYANLDKTYGELDSERKNLKMQLGETNTDDFLKRQGREIGYYEDGEQVIVIKKEDGKTDDKKEQVPQNKTIGEQVIDFLNNLINNRGK